MRYFELSEHEVVHSLGEADLTQYFNQSEQIGDLDGFEIRLFTHNNQLLYMLCSDVILSHIIIEITNGIWWAKEMRAHIHGKMHASKLLVWLIKNVHSPVYNDIQLTADSIHALEKIAKGGEIQAGIANLESGLVTPYDTTSGLYDMPVSGIPRPAITSTDAKKLVLVFEQQTRSGLLSPYVKYCPDTLLSLGTTALP